VIAHRGHFNCHAERTDPILPDCSPEPIFTNTTKMIIKKLFLIFLVASGFSCAAIPLAAQAQTSGSPALFSDGSAEPQLDPFFDDLEERTFHYFWDTANPANGLVPDRFPSPSFASIAAIGFALSAYPIGVERHYISRAAARQRVLTTLKFFYNAPQGNAAHGMTGYKGFYYHFLDMKTGQRYRDSELSTVDTALLLGGVLFCQSYFDQDQADEVQIRDLAKAIYERVDWPWTQVHSAAIDMGWTPEQGFIASDWVGYNEGMIVYLMALGSPAHAVNTDAWNAWTRNFDKSWKVIDGQEHLGFPPMFGHQYTEMWVDFRNIQDSYMKNKGIDYFENGRRATLAQQAYAVRNPMQCKGYEENIWGITASDGPKSIQLDYHGKPMKFHGYAGRGMGGANTYDDCTLAPTAALGSIVFAPELVIPAAQALHQKYGRRIYKAYGFLDAFNPSFDFNTPITTGTRIPGEGWVGKDYIGIDQGPIIGMLENYRSGLVWRVMRGNPYIRTGLERAGFTGGWLAR